jgi:hypothetical protein
MASFASIPSTVLHSTNYISPAPLSEDDNAVELLNIRLTDLDTAEDIMVKDVVKGKNTVIGKFLARGGLREGGH